MNADDIRNIPAGRELDILIATKLFGWRWFQYVRETPLGTTERLVLLPADCKLSGYIPVTIGPEDAHVQQEETRHYSTDRAACGAVIEWASDHGIYVTIYHCLDLDVVCKCWSHDDPENEIITSDHNESAAICKAMLICAAELDTANTEAAHGL